MKQQAIATHTGTITDIQTGTVTVQIHTVSACASCQAHGKCTLADSQDKTLQIPTPHWKQYHVGQPITIRISQQRGLLAVAIAYILPALLIIAVATTLSLTNAKETTVILATFATIATYTLLLYLLRHRINNQFTLEIC